MAAPVLDGQESVILKLGPRRENSRRKRRWLACDVGVTLGNLLEQHPRRSGELVPDHGQSPPARGWLAPNMRCIEEQGAPNVDTRDAARQLGVSLRELYHLIDAGKLPAYKVGRDIKLRQADVDTFRRGRTGGA